MPLPEQVIPQRELKVMVKRFLADPNRGISIEMFAELAGLDTSTIRDVFIKEEFAVSEYVQRRVSKAYQAFVNGEVAVMQNRDGTRFLKYRDTPKPRFARTQRLKVVNGRIQLDVGVRSRHDYTLPTLDEQMR